MSLKIIFMGTPEFAVSTLKSLYESKHKLQAVYTKPPKKRDRGQKVLASPVFQFAEKHNITVRHPKEFSDEEYDFIKNLNTDVVIVVAYGKLIPKLILDLPNCLFINIHASLLPKWRGAAPIQRAIMNMDEETGISIMKIISELDAGPVMKTVKTKIFTKTTHQDLSSELSNLASLAILDSLDLIEKNKEQFIEQDNSKATYANKIDKDETKIKWNMEAKKIIAKVNAFYSKPGAWFEMDKTRIKVLKAVKVNKKGKPGEIIDKNFTIGCLDGAIQILELKPEGKKSMSSLDFSFGHELIIGKILNGV